MYKFTMQAPGHSTTSPVEILLTTEDHPCADDAALAWQYIIDNFNDLSPDNFDNLSSATDRVPEYVTTMLDSVGSLDDRTRLSDLRMLFKRMLKLAVDVWIASGFGENDIMRYKGEVEFLSWLWLHLRVAQVLKDKVKMLFGEILREEMKICKCKLAAELEAELEMDEWERRQMVD